MEDKDAKGEASLVAPAVKDQQQERPLGLNSS